MTEPRSLNAAAIGRRLRELRGQRDLSLRQLARLIGASPSLLSQVENGKVTPSVDTLYQLAGALGVPITGFFADADADGGRRPEAGVVRATERQRIELEHGVRWENLLADEIPGLRFLEVTYAPGATSGEVFLRQPGRTLLLVLGGELTVRTGFSEHRLGTGDSVAFAGFEPHQLRNEGAVEARAVVCIVADGER